MELNVIKASVSVVDIEDPLKRIEYAARVCYNSTDKITEYSAESFVRRLLARGHYTPLEAAGCNDTLFGVRTARDLYTLCKRHNDHYHEAETAEDLFIETLRERKSDPDYVTYEIVCDRGIGNELVRHRSLMFADTPLQAFQDCGYNPPLEMSMVQESTRYVNFEKTGMSVILPEPAEWVSDTTSKPYQLWLSSCMSACKAYSELIAQGITPQYARNVLPLSTATRIVMSGYPDMWEAFFKLREAEGAHPQMRHLCSLMKAASSTH